MLIRKPVCAGTWYPAQRDEISGYIEKKIPGDIRGKAVACLCPHAGWIYSGSVAGSVYSLIDIKSYDTFFLIGPNHTGYGARAGVFPGGEWQMPLGNVTVDEELVKLVIQFSEFIEPDTRSHVNEHCLEVQIPFIQYFKSDAKIVPIVIMHDDIDVSRDIASAVVAAIKRAKIEDRALLIASSDMTHYESQTLARQKDRLAIDSMLNLDAEDLVKTVVSKGITMCGVYAAASVILAARQLGANTAQLVKYSTSGDVTGDNTSVVGYAGIIFNR